MKATLECNSTVRTWVVWFRQPPSTRCSTVSARYVRPSHLRCRWTNDMELVPKQFAWAGHANWLFSSYTVSFWSVLGTLSALEALFATMRCINWHLHYITLPNDFEYFEYDNVVLCWLPDIWVALTFISHLGFHRVTFAISVSISYCSLFCHGIPIHLICLLLVGLFCLFLSFCIDK